MAIQRKPAICLQDQLDTFGASGVQVAVSGAAAVALIRHSELPACAPWSLWVRADFAAAVAPPEATITHLFCDVSAFAETVAEQLRQQAITAWAVAVLADGTTVDPLQGLADIAQSRLRLVQEPRQFLRAQPGRVLDLAVLVAQSGLTPAADLMRHAQREAGNVLGLDRAIWCCRFDAVLLGDFASLGLQFLCDIGALQLMIPEVCAMIDFHKSCPVHHKDIWDHTLQVVDKCPPTLTVRWAALMHDSGKVWTRTLNKGKVHFFRHEELGASLMEGVAGRFHMPPALRDRVVYIIANHARANVYAAEWTDSAVRRLIRDMGDHLRDVLAFSQSDFTTKRQWRIAEVRALTEELGQRILRIADADARVPPLPKGLGDAIMLQTGLQAGPWLGEVQRWLQSQCDDGILPPLQDAAFYLAHVQANRPELLQITPGTERQRKREKN